MIWIFFEPQSIFLSVFKASLVYFSIFIKNDSSSFRYSTLLIGLPKKHSICHFDHCEPLEGDILKDLQMGLVGPQKPIQRYIFHLIVLPLEGNWYQRRTLHKSFDAFDLPNNMILF